MAKESNTFIKVVTFKVTGISSVLLHNPACMQQNDSGDVNRKRIPSPEDEAERSAYRLPDGQLYVQAIAFRGSMINKGGGASGLRLGKKSLISAISAAVSIIDGYDKCPLYHCKTGKPISTYTIDRRRAVVQGNGVVRARACVAEWACDVTFEVNEDFCTIDQVLQTLNISGRQAGVGDYRPQCKGWFGKFEAALKK